MLSVEGANRALDARWGSAHAAGFPSTVTVRMWNGDPLESGVELDSTNYPGYASFTVTNNDTNFPDASGGSKTTAELAGGTATGDWDDAPTHFTLADGSTILEVIEVQNVEGLPGNGDPITVQGTISRPA